MTSTPDPAHTPLPLSPTVAAEIAAELADELGGIAPELAIKRLPAVPTVREVRRLLDCTKEDPRAHLIVRILYATGIRAGELAALHFAHVAFDVGTIFIDSGKGDRDRYVCVDARTLELIRAWQGERALSTPVVGIKTDQIAHVVREFGLRAGLVQKYEGMGRSFSPHSLRHAFATHRHDAGMDLFALQRLLGHQFLSTTLIYVETSMKQLIRQYRKADPLREK